MKRKETILLVDDSESDTFLMRAAFRKAEFDSSLQVVCDGEEAIAYLKGEGPYGDRTKFPLPVVVLVDLNMPRKNGFDVLAWLRAQPGLRRLPVIVMTASIRIDDVERAFDAGANSYLVKPSDLQSLISMMRCLRDWIRINEFPSLRVRRVSL